MSTKIKICGLKSPEDIACVNEYRPDYAGFVFYPPSSRYVTVEKALDLTDRLSPGITPVGVFLDNPIDEILKVQDSGAVKVLQIHGARAPELVRQLKDLTPLPVWEALRIRSEEDIEEAMKSPADLVLLDHGFGGTGETFDWSFLERMERDFFLAGGLNAANIKDALKWKPYGVDTSSGVETDGNKDPEKIREFIRMVRAE